MLIDVGLILGTGLLMYELSEPLLSCLGGSRNCFKDDYVLVIGHTKGLFKTPITVDMRATPHLLCCGLSGQGKSRCIEYAIKDKDVILLNAFKDDFKAVKARKIIGNENILHFLENIIKEPYKRDKPLYIVIDELLVCCTDKKINNAIKDLLAVGRHYNIFIIGIAQRGTKTDLSFKDLFNARMTFRQVESSSYQAILGCSIEDKRLNKREFILMSDDIYYGKTYDI